MMSRKSGYGIQRRSLMKNIPNSTIQWKNVLAEKKPIAWSHFIVESDVEFNSILFIPSKAPSDVYENCYSAKANLKLYVRRIFISDEFEKLFPKYLGFVMGIVDSNTFPLNVSREMIQQHSSLNTIKKNLIRKALYMIRQIAK